MTLTVHVKPNAKETKFISWLDDTTVVIAISTPPAEGKANIELLEFLAKKLKVAKTHLILARGHASRVKHVIIPPGAKLTELK